MRNLITTELNDGSVYPMAPKALDLFLGRNEVVRFRRADGWVIVGQAHLRDRHKPSTYSGPERRQVA